MSYYVKRVLSCFWKECKKNDALRILHQDSIENVIVEDSIFTTDDHHSMKSLNCYYLSSFNHDIHHPCVFDIHGGGWMYGDRSLNNNYCKYIASKGYPVTSTSYRLLPQVSLKEMIQDIFSSFYFLENFGPSRGFDIDNVLLTGDSAGAHLAILCLIINNDERLQKIYKVKKSKLKFKLLSLNHPVCFTDDFNFTIGKCSSSTISKTLRSMMIKNNGSVMKLG